MPDAPLSDAQRRVLDDAFGLVRDQKGGDPDGPAPEAWASPFGLGYVLGAVDGLCSAHGVAFDGMGLALVALVLDDTFGRPRSDALRQRALALLDADDEAFGRGRQWGGNEAIGFAQGQHVPVGLVRLARGDAAGMR